MRKSVVQPTVIIGLLLILSGILINPYTLTCLIRLSNGQTSLLRTLCLWIYDLLAISFGLKLLIKRNQIKFNFQKICFSMILIISLFLFMELVLQVICRISAPVNHLISNNTVPRTIRDDILEVRPNPDFPEHDANGFRNKTVLENPDIIALGDSQTYGTHLKVHQAWPQQLALVSGQSVYNISCGGYGPVEALYLLKNEISKKPKQVIFAMYDGNDLVDSFLAVYDLNLLPKLKTDDPVNQQKILVLEQEKPLKQEMQKISTQMWGPQSQQQNNEGSQHKAGFSIKRLKLLQLFFSIERAVQAAATDRHETNWQKIASQKKKESTFFDFFQAQQLKTILTPIYRGQAMNVHDPRIDEGLQISQKAIEKMNSLCQQASIQFMVILIPTKEKVFYDIFPEYNLEPTEAMTLLNDREVKIRQQIKETLLNNNIPYVDALPLLVNCLKQGKQPFFVDSDGHLNQQGQHTVAEAVNDLITARENKTP